MLIDITQELFSCNVFPGDPQPERKQVQSIENGDICNLTELSMCAHNGTHADAPYHFIKDGKTIDRMGLEPFVGDCFVARMDGGVLAEDAVKIMKRAEDAGAPQKDTDRRKSDRYRRGSPCICRSRHPSSGK